MIIKIDAINDRALSLLRETDNAIDGTFYLIHDSEGIVTLEYFDREIGDGFVCGRLNAFDRFNIF